MSDRAAAGIEPPDGQYPGLGLGRLRLELRRPGELDVRAVLSRHERLLADFGALHRCLAIGAHGGMVALADYFPAFSELLCRAVLAPIGARCELSVADIWLDAERCEKLALIVAELVMNAAKYAFGNGADGCVRIAIDGGPDGIVCRVLDNGCGGALLSGGIGTRILTGLVDHLEGQIASRSGATGTEFVIWLPQGGRDSAISS